MKLFTLFAAVFFFAGSIVSTTASYAAEKSMNVSSRVRTVPGSADQKKKEAGKVNPVKTAPSQGAAPCAQHNTQTTVLESTLWIGNGGKPK